MEIIVPLKGAAAHEPKGCSAMMQEDAVQLIKGPTSAT